MRGLMNFLAVGLLIIGVVAVVYMVTNHTNEPEGTREVRVEHSIDAPDVNVDIPAVDRTDHSESMVPSEGLNAPQMPDEPRTAAGE